MPKNKNHRNISGVVFIIIIVVAIFVYSKTNTQHFSREDFVEAKETKKEEKKKDEKKVDELDKEAYDAKLEYVANNPKPKPIMVATTTADGSTTTIQVIPEQGPTLYPTDAVYPKVGALLPFNRIIAYYGNFYSKNMGALGEYESDEMIRRLKLEIDKWNIADPETPAIPAIHYIASTAQGSPGKEGLYTLRMPDDQIDHAVELAEKIDGIVFLDLQIGLSSLQKEIPFLDKYLQMPQVHLGIDPEFSMKTGAKPGTVIGTFSDSDVNFAIKYLSDIVKKYDLPPKILVVHRFTTPMVQNYQNIKPTPEVQIVMHMDGWGAPHRKFGTYNYIVAPEPIQFTGFKIFYKNDLKEDPPRLVTPSELMTLTPRPIYIQYQ